MRKPVPNSPIAIGLLFINTTAIKQNETVKEIALKRK
jgi:hypothetical protein